MAKQTTQIKPPEDLPFLQAICWQTGNVKHFTPEEMLDRYERGVEYRGVLADLKNDELDFVRKLAKAHGSWLSVDL